MPSESVNVMHKYLLCTNEHLLADENALVNEKGTCRELETSVVKDLALRINRELAF